MAESDKGLTVFSADRVSAGDVINVPGDSRLEIVCGNNIVFVLGPGARLRMLGLRSFAGPDGERMARLDVYLEQGEMRAQARLNKSRETLLIGVQGAEVLLLRGDVDVFSDSGWSAITLDGEASARLRRGGVVGAPFALDPGIAFGSAGSKPLSEGEVAVIRTRLPFSFEIINAALPPRPATGSFLDAP